MASEIHFGTDNSAFQAGIINGSVTTAFHHYASQERPETPPNPSAIIPFTQDKDFIQRDDILDRIHQACAIPASRIALVGLGGVGKSQLAIEYAHQVRHRSPDTWVFWVHASNAGRYEQSFRDIADHVKIPGRHDPRSNILQLVRNWLRSGTSRRWRLILDNIDDASFLLVPPSLDKNGPASIVDRPNLLPLVDYLPACENGSILITSRNKDAALELVEPSDIIPVESMNQAEAEALIETKLRAEKDKDNIGALAAALECMPLAIVQATAYISKRAPRCSVRQYLKKFERGDQEKASLLNFEARQLRRDREAKNSIIITWQISFDHIRQTRPSAADLLSLMSFCDRQGIPETLLRPLGRNEDAASDDPDSNGELSDEEAGSDYSSDDEFEEDIRTLRDYSFISTNEDGKTFEMHRLVQLATTTWLEAEGQQERWIYEFICRLDAQLPYGDYEDWPTCQTLLPHTISAAAQRPEDETSLIKLTSILRKAAWYLLEIGQCLEAQMMAEDAMKYSIQIYGRSHVESAYVMDMLGRVYLDRGQWTTAEKLFLEALETLKQKLGVGHPDTLTSMSNLAMTFWEQGKWEAAEKLNVEVLATSKQKLGAGHPDTLISMSNLASTFWEQGKWEAAEKLNVEVLATSKQKLGAGHPNTLIRMSNLASTFMEQGKWEAAEKLNVEVLATSKQKLGAGHPGTLISMSNLARVWENRGRHREALVMMRECVRLERDVLGADHPSYLSSLEALNDWELKHADVNASET